MDYSQVAVISNLITIIVLNSAAASFFYVLKKNAHPGYAPFPNHFHLFFLIVAASYIAAAILPVISQPLSTFVGNSLVIGAYYVLLAGLLSRVNKHDEIRRLVAFAAINLIAYLAMEVTTRVFLGANINGVMSRVVVLLNLIVLVAISFRYVIRRPDAVVVGERVMRASLIVHIILASITLVLALMFVDIFIYMTFIMGIILANTLLMTGSLLLMLLSDQIEKNYALSIEDPLTTLYNRRFFYERLEQELEHHHRHHRPLTVILADLDYFKRINDAFGHQFGDKVLIQFASILKHEKRVSDIPARFGGEEFVVLLPDTSREDALHWAERVLEATRQIDIDGKRPLTVSMGLASVSGRKESLAALLKRCDDALYSAKRHGRDQIVVSDINQDENVPTPV